MKIVKPDLLSPFELYDDRANFIALENKNIFYSFVLELYESVEGEQRSIVLSKDDVPIKIPKTVELLTHFIPFEINTKKLITKLYDKLSKMATNEDMISDTFNIEENIQSFVVKLCDYYSFELEFDNNIDIKSLLKIVNLKFADNYQKLIDKLFEYMTNIRELDGEKLFVFVNLSMYLTDEDLQLFVETAVNHRFYILLIENNDNVSIPNINKRIIDDDLCEI